MVLVALAKMATTMANAVLYLFTPELFPVQIRMTAVGTCSMIARLGSYLASYVFLWSVNRSLQLYINNKLK